MLRSRPRRVKSNVAGDASRREHAARPVECALPPETPLDAPVALPLTSTDAAAVPAADLGLRFDNSFARLPGTFYTRLAPTPLPDPYLVAFPSPRRS